MKEKMRDGIKEKYGYNTGYEEENKDLTEAWDLVQTRVTIYYVIFCMKQSTH